jgi:transposase
LSGKTPLGKALQYGLSRWDALTRYVEDGRLSIDNNPAERLLRGIAMTGSLCRPSSSVWKHWKCVRAVNATRATFSGDRRFDRMRGKVVGADLVRSTRHDLHGRQNAGRNQAPYHVVGDIQGFRGLAHGEPFATFLG